jgi:hypothetical protein
MSWALSNVITGFDLDSAIVEKTGSIFKNQAASGQNHQGAIAVAPEPVGTEPRKCRRMKREKAVSGRSPRVSLVLRLEAMWVA